MSSPSPLPTEFGRYQVLEELGSGAMGVVYLCVDPRLSRPVAIKVMRESEFMTPAERDQFQKRFRHEAEAAGRLTHPDIVQIYDVGPSWMVMEFLEGQPLNALLKRGERLSVRRVVQLVARVADAVDYAHRHGIVHRDIKPANIMLLDDGTSVKVMDFGVARLEHSTLTALGTVVGSVRYMSPEQMMGERVDGRADVFSVAAVAYELLTGQAPFPGKTITEVVSRVVHGAHVPPRKADQRLPATLDAVFAQAFAPQPAQRYPRAADFARDLLEACSPALDLEVASVARAETLAPTSTPAATVPAPPRLPAAPDGLQTVVLDEGRRLGRLLVETSPAGARLVVDGEAVTGDAAFEGGLELPFGTHVVRLSAEGFSDAECVVELLPGHPVVHFQAALRRAEDVKESPDFLALGGDVSPPRRISGAWPSAPAGEPRAGVAIVDAYVRETGEVSRVVEVSGDKRLSGALLEAVLGWRFRPAERKGAPVAARLRIQHVFLP